MDKQKLRQSIRVDLQALDNESYQIKSKLLSTHLLDLISELISKHGYENLKLGVYSPFQKEPIWFSEFSDEAYDYLVVHMYQDSHLSFHPVDLKTIKSGATSLELDLKHREDEATPDIILIPGLGFTQKRERLGRGKGYFDRYLAGFKGIKVGVCFDVQIKADVMSEAHDVEMDYLVTETKIYRRG